MLQCDWVKLEQSVCKKILWVTEWKFKCYQQRHPLLCFAEQMHFLVGCNSRSCVVSVSRCNCSLLPPTRMWALTSAKILVILPLSSTAANTWMFSSTLRLQLAPLPFCLLPFPAAVGSAANNQAPRWNDDGNNFQNKDNANVGLEKRDIISRQCWDSGI